MAEWPEMVQESHGGLRMGGFRPLFEGLQHAQSSLEISGCFKKH